jgi:hypothetical protein
VFRIELFECSATHQVFSRPDSPEGDLGLSKSIEIERVNALGRRMLMHFAQVIGEQFGNFAASKIVRFYGE